MKSTGKPANCERCGIEWEWLEKHHVIPQSQGGKDGPTLWLCQNCHEDLQGTMGKRVSDTTEAQAKRSQSFHEWYDSDPANREHRAATMRASHARGERKHIGALTSEWHATHPDENAERIRRISATKKGGDPDRWAVGYEACVECGTTDQEHDREGLCSRCSARRRYRERLLDVAGTWKGHGSCIVCDTQESPYGSKGMCRRCYGRLGARKRSRKEKGNATV